MSLETDTRALVQVAVGVLVQPDGSFLMTSRPQGKVYAGYWEFPGGKVEVGETVEQALARELHEELGITVLDVQPWRTLEVSYPHARVHLNFCKVSRWGGELSMREQQSFAWQSLPVTVHPVLPGSLPVLEWLGEQP
jgi:8-oxo-dGTP diphosphatase